MNDFSKLTPEEIAAKKLQYWGPERNQHRRDRYQDDPAYREQVKAQVRESFRKQRESLGISVRDEDCRENIGLLPEIARVRETSLPNGERLNLMTLTAEEMAELLNRNLQVFYRWQNADMFPKPAFFCIGHRGRKQGVFLEDEALAILEVYGAHQETSQYYKAHHTETRDALFAAVAAVRARLLENGDVAGAKE